MYNSSSQPPPIISRPLGLPAPTSAIVNAKFIIVNGNIHNTGASVELTGSQGQTYLCAKEVEAARRETEIEASPGRHRPAPGAAGKPWVICVLWGMFALMNPLVLGSFLVFFCELREDTFNHSYLQKKPFIVVRSQSLSGQKRSAATPSTRRL